MNHKLLFQASKILFQAGLSLHTGEIDWESRKYLTQFHSQRKPQLSLTRKETHSKSTARDEEKLEAQILNIPNHDSDKSKGKKYLFLMLFSCDYLKKDSIISKLLLKTEHCVSCIFRTASVSQAKTGICSTYQPNSWFGIWPLQMDFTWYFSCFT